MTRNRLAPFALCLVTLAGCATASPPAPPTPPGTTLRTSITDTAAFDAYIATRPTPEALRARYPGLLVVLPGDISTRELRGDNSRYFAELDAHGRVIGGKFQ